jgi:hypothetical protein
MARATLGVVAGVVLVGALTTSVLAHHGWEWTQPNLTEMTGKILKIYVGSASSSDPHRHRERRRVDHRFRQPDANP